jgi:hypothetical protein
MHAHPTSYLLLAEARHRELMDENARYWLARQATGAGPGFGCVMTAAWQRLALAIVCVGETLRLPRLSRLHAR